MGKLWDLYQEYLDRQPFPPSQRRVAEALKMSPTAFGNWRSSLKSLPAADNLLRFSDLVRLPYPTVLDAALHDAGYLPQPQRQLGPGSFSIVETDRGADGTVVEVRRYITRIDLEHLAEVELRRPPTDTEIDLVHSFRSEHTDPQEALLAAFAANRENPDSVPWKVVIELGAAAGADLGMLLGDLEDPEVQADDLRVAARADTSKKRSRGQKARDELDSVGEESQE